MQYILEIHPNAPKPFHCVTLQRRELIPNVFMLQISRTSQINTKINAISAHKTKYANAHINGGTILLHNRTLLAPPDTTLVIHRRHKSEHMETTWSERVVFRAVYIFLLKL